MLMMKVIYRGQMFYINYEECKLSGTSSFKAPVNGFILTMRNVNS